MSVLKVNGISKSFDNEEIIKDIFLNPKSLKVCLTFLVTKHEYNIIGMANITMPCIRNVDNNELGLALKGANEEVQGVIFNNLSKRLAQMIKEDMEFMGPVRMKDVEEAQQKIVNIIRKLEDSGEIVISRGGGDEIVV